MALSDYKKPGLVSFQVEDAKFVVELPTRWNKAYTRFWQEALMDEEPVQQGKSVSATKRQAMVVVDAQREGFARCCIKESPLTVEELLGDYTPLLDAIHSAAEKLANEEEAKAETLVGKLLPTLSGSESGEDKSISTQNSEKRAA